VPIDGAIADRRGLIAAEAKRTGKPLSVSGLLAATAPHRNLTGLAQCRRLYDCAASGLESVESVTFGQGTATRHGTFGIAMRTLAWIVTSLFVALIVWWWFDPVGFSQNPVLRWFKAFSVPLPERLR